MAEPYNGEAMTDSDKRRAMLVEDRIETIVREEMRAARGGGGGDGGGRAGGGGGVTTGGAQVNFSFVFFMEKYRY